MAPCWQEKARISKKWLQKTAVLNARLPAVNKSRLRQLGLLNWTCSFNGGVCLRWWRMHRAWRRVRLTNDTMPRPALWNEGQRRVSPSLHHHALARPSLHMGTLGASSYSISCPSSYQSPPSRASENSPSRCPSQTVRLWFRRFLKCWQGWFEHVLSTIVSSLQINETPQPGSWHILYHLISFCGVLCATSSSDIQVNWNNGSAPWKQPAVDMVSAPCSSPRFSKQFWGNGCWILDSAVEGQTISD